MSAEMDTLELINQGLSDPKTPKAMKTVLEKAKTAAIREQIKIHIAAVKDLRAQLPKAAQVEEEQGQPTAPAKVRMRR